MRNEPNSEQIANYVWLWRVSNAAIKMYCDGGHYSEYIGVWNHCRQVRETLVDSLDTVNFHTAFQVMELLENSSDERVQQ